MGDAQQGYFTRLEYFLTKHLGKEPMILNIQNKPTAKNVNVCVVPKIV